MKTSFSGVAAIALALAVCGGPVLAQAAAPAQTAAPAAVQAPHRARMAEPVSQTDFVQRRVARLRGADANGDGQVTAEEMRAHAQTRQAERAAEQAKRRAAVFDRLDADKDGVLSRAEFEARSERAEHSQRAGRMGARHRMARDGGGRMNRAARPDAAQRGQSRFPIVIADVETKAAETFARMDANRDGVLTVDERRAAMQADRAERREKHEQRRVERRSGASAASPSAPASE